MRCVCRNSRIPHSIDVSCLVCPRVRVVACVPPSLSDGVVAGASRLAGLGHVVCVRVRQRSGDGRGTDQRSASEWSRRSTWTGRHHIALATLETARGNSRRSEGEKERRQERTALIESTCADSHRPACLQLHALGISGCQRSLRSAATMMQRIGTKQHCKDGTGTTCIQVDASCLPLSLALVCSSA